MTPEELAASVKADILEVKNSLGSFAKEADLQAKFTSLEEQVKKAGENKELSEQLKGLETAMLEQGKVLKELKEKQGEEKHKSIEELLFEKKEAIKIAFEQNGKVTIKADAVSQVGMTSPTGLASGLILPGIGQIPQRMPMIRSFFNQNSIGNDSRNEVRYMEQTAVVNGTDVFAEGSLLPVGTFPAWEEKTLKLKNIGVLLPVSEIALDNFAFINQEVNTLLKRNFDLVIERELYAGTGLTTHLVGLKTVATAFTVTGTPLEQNQNKFDNPEEVELIMAIQKIIENNSLGTASEFNAGSWSPTVVFMNGFDALRMKLRKNKDGDIVNLPYLSADGTRVGSIRIVESNLIDTNTMLVADSSVFELYSGGMRLDIGYNSDDFNKMQKSIRLYEHIMPLVRNLNKGGVVYVSDIAAAKSAITKINA